MPFISKKRFYDIHLRALPPSHPDVTLLLLCLNLITSLPPVSPRNPRTPLYHAAKHFYLELEGDVAFSILILQAGVLLGLYEMGHGIYPAAFLTIGACARYAHALGINARRTGKSRKVLTLEKKGVVGNCDFGSVRRQHILRFPQAEDCERFVSIGCPGRPLATVEPGLNDLLPADDAEWDRGIINPDSLSTLSEPLSGHMSRFALLCQAARLLGQVLLHLSNDSVENDDVWIQLDRTLQSMLAASLDVDVPDDDQIAFVYSTLVALHNLWLSSPTGVESKRSLRAKEVVQQITARVKMNLTERQCFMGRNPDDVLPWGLFFAYRICAYHIFTGSKTDHSLAEVVKSMRETFSTIDVRWNVAGVYLQLLEAQEAMSLS